MCTRCDGTVRSRKSRKTGEGGFHTVLLKEVWSDEEGQAH